MDDSKKESIVQKNNDKFSNSSSEHFLTPPDEMPVISEKKRLFNQNLKKFSLALFAIFCIVAGIFIILNFIFQSIPSSSITKDKTNLPENLQSKGFIEVEDDTKGVKFKLSLEPQKLHFPSEFVYLLGSKNFTDSKSTIYKVYPNSQQKYFSTQKTIIDFQIYQNEVMLYTTISNQIQQLWIRDESYESILIYTASLGEQILSAKIDFPNNSVYILTYKNSILTLKRVDSGSKVKEIKILGNITSRAMILNIDKNILSIIDDAICYNMSLSNLNPYEVNCLEILKNSEQDFFQIRPVFKILSSSNDGSTIDKYNFDQKKYIRIYNAPTGQMLVEQYYHDKKIIFSKFGLNFNLQLNRYEANWQSFVIFDTINLNFSTLTNLLPASNLNVQNTQIFSIGNSYYILVYGSVDKLYKYDPSNQLNPLSIPSQPSQPVYNSVWNPITFINSEEYDKLQLYYEKYFN
jgi:hypothetical protein